MRRVALACTVISLVPLFTTAAQEPGQRIRVRIESAPSRWVVGTLIAGDRDSLRVLVAGSGQRVSLARSAVRRMEFSRGHSRAVVEGLAAGSGVGVLLGANAAGRRQSSRVCPDDLSGLCALDMEADMMQAVMAAAVIGGVVGAAVGFAVRSERWQAAGSSF
jgi:hypothetical protein